MGRAPNRAGDGAEAAASWARAWVLWFVERRLWEEVWREGGEGSKPSRGWRRSCGELGSCLGALPGVLPVGLPHRL